MHNEVPLSSCLFGQEAEIAIAAYRPSGVRFDQDDLNARLMDAAKSEFDCLPARGGQGIFLGNGGKLYIDCGKPEYCTPETTNPTELCNYVRAGEKILLKIGDKLCSDFSSIGQVVFNRSITTYGPSVSTWGCHESYSHQVTGNKLATHLIPHLVSRIIYTGGGGFEVNKAGIHFSISPRVGYLTRTSSSSTQSDRGIFNTKNEPLNGNGFHRAHVICGENISGGLFLKFGTTMLIIRLIEQGVDFNSVHLARPLRAIRKYTLDPSLTATANTSTGEPLTALQIQKHYQTVTEQHLGNSYMPEWAAEVVGAWKEMLISLEKKDQRVSRTLDWAIKLSLFEKHIQQSGTDWSRIGALNQILAKCWESFPPRTNAQFKRNASTFKKSEFVKCFDRLPKGSVDRQFTRDDIEQAINLRDQLFELDVRYGQLGSLGIHSQLRELGVLNDGHDSDSLEIDRAISFPPSAGRARLRGQFVRQVCAQKKTGECDWSTAWNMDDRLVLDLSFPYAETEKFVAWPGDLDHSDSIVMLVDEMVQQGVRLHDQGLYRDALLKFRRAQSLLPRSANESEQIHRYIAWSLTRLTEPEAKSIFDNVHRADQQSSLAICDYLYFYRFQGLLPPTGFKDWLKRGLEIMNSISPNRSERLISILCHQGFYFLCEGLNDEAIRVFEDSTRRNRLGRAHWRINARLHAEHAEACRRTGGVRKAEELLENAQQIQIENGCEGDRSDFTLPTFAKLRATTDRIWAADALHQALQIQRTQKNHAGELRSLVLLARIDHSQNSQQLAAIKRRIQRIQLIRPVFSKCEKLAEILRFWTDWICASESEIKDDDYWNL